MRSLSVLTLVLATLCSVAFFSSATGAAAPEAPSAQAVLSFTAAPAELTQHEGTDVTFSLTRDGKPLTNTKLHVADNPAFGNMPTGPQRTNHRGILVMPGLTPQSFGPQAIEISALGQSLRVQFTVLPATASPASPASTPSPSGALPSESASSGPSSRAGLSSGTASSGAGHTPLSHTLFNATASFLGVPGLSPVVGTDGLRDEGLGFHADGTTRRAGGSDAASGSGDFSGQRAASYAFSGLNNDRLPWLYDSYAGLERDREGRAWDMGSEYSGLRAKNVATSGGLGFSSYGGNNGNRGIFDSVLMRGLSAGMGFANTALESGVLGLMGGLMGKDSPYGNGKARFSFYLDADGRNPVRLQGEGDILWPLYDSLHTTIYTQFGARSMYGGGDEYGPDRWIGNIGVGQRWFPGAFVNEDGKPNSGNWMLGYNAFYDVDITRGHERGGVGLEAQYDWLKVATNWYLPISDWKDSTDFDGDYVRERAAQGWDLRVKGYLPFYREIALTGAYTQWYGQYVGLFGPSKLEKDPRVWSYGIEYTPIPALTAYVNQRQSERGNADTEFGLRFTYNFGMDAESQFKPSRVAETRTVHGSRHDFVDRENKIILEYQTKKNIYLDFVSYREADKTFIFRVRDGFNKNKPGQLVQVAARGAVTLAFARPEARQSFFAEVLDHMRALFAAAFSVLPAYADSAHSYISDSGGLVYVRVDDVNKLTHLQVGAEDVVRIYDRAALTLPPAPEITLTAEKANLPNQTTTTLTLINASINSPVTWKVEGTANASAGAGAGAVTGGDKTSAEGKATATFTASGMGAATVTATVGTESASTVLTIAAGAHTLEANPATLTQNTPTAVTFTVKKNGTAVPVNTAVTFTSNASFTNLPTTAQNTDASGQIVVSNLTATAAGSQTVEITVDGQKATTPLTVTASAYTLTASESSLYESTPKSVTFTLARNGSPLANIAVGLSSSDFTGIPTTQTTNASGQFTLTGLTATTVGTSTIIATVPEAGASSPFTFSFVVSATRYTLGANPTTLTLNTITPVRFTVLRNDEPLPVGSSVTFSGDTTIFPKLPTGSLSGSGMYEITDFTATAAGTHTITVTANDGKTATCPLTVVTAKYSAISSHRALVQHQPQAVTFSVKKDGSPALTTSSVTFADSSASFRGLPTTPQPLSGGQVTVPALTGTKAGNPTLVITVDGQNVPLGMSITSAATNVEASHAALTQHTGEDVILTVKQNGKPAGSGVAVSITADGINFYNLPASGVTNTSSQVTLPKLTALTTGPQRITGNVGGVGGQPFTVPLQVHAVGYTVQASHSALTQHVAQTVTFTVMRGGKAAPANIPVSFAPHAAFPHLNTAEQRTNGIGQVTLTNLVGTATGTHNLQATVARQTPSHAVPLSVSPASYSLSASPHSMTAGSPATVTFTVLRNGVALTPSDKVRFTPNPALNLPGGDHSVGSGGTITVPDLTATASGSQTVEVTVNASEGKAQTTLAVSSASYSLSAAHSGLTQHTPARVIFTVRQGVNPVPADTLVVFTPSAAWANLPGSAMRTTIGGQIMVPTLTPLTSGRQTVEITVGGQKTSASLDVAPVAYGLNVSPTSMNQHEPKDVTFTFTRGGSPLSPLTQATAVTFAANSQFLNLPRSVNTTASGTVFVPGLITTAASAQTVTASIDGQTVSTILAVTAANYTLAASPATLIQNKSTNVTFTVQRGGTTVKAGIPVRFSENANFTNIPSGELKTDASGQVFAPGLAITAPTGQTLTATVAGQKVNVGFIVTPAAYTVTANPSALTQHRATDVAFTVLQQDGKAAPAGIPVTFGTNANFTNLPTGTQNTNASGQVLVPGLTTTASSGQTLSLTAGGQSLTQPFGVTPATYALTPDQSILTQGTAQRVVFTLTRNGQIAPGVSLTFIPNANITGLPSTVSTDAAGQIPTTLTALTKDKLTLDTSVDDQRVSTALGVNGKDFTVSASPATLTQYKGENVNLTVTGWGSAGNIITIVPHAAFTNLPASVDVGAAGRGTLPNLIANTTGNHVLEFVHPVDGSRAYTSLAVSAPEYKISASPATGLVKDKATSVTFTLTRGGSPLPNTVPVTFSGAAFTGLPAGPETTTGGGGSVTYTLTPTAEGSHNITATAEGVSFDTSLTVGAAEYALTLAAAPASIKAFASSTLTATVTKNGVTAPDGTVVNWSVVSGPGVFTSGEGTAGEGATARTSSTSGGKASVTMQGTGAGAVALRASAGSGAGSGTGTGTVTVTEAEYVLTASQDTLTQHQGQDVVFTLTRNGSPLTNTAVTLSGEGFSGLPPSPTTSALGKITVPGLTATVAGNQTVEVTVNGQKATANFTVTAADLALTPSTTELVHHMGQDVVLTLTRNGAALANTAVSFSGDFGVLASQTTNASGQFTLSGLTATTLSNHKLTATVDGVTTPFELTFTVKDAVYLMTASPLALTQHKGQDVVFTLTRNGAALANTSVTLTSTDFTGLSVTQNTNGSGQITLTKLMATEKKEHIITATVPAAGGSSPFTFKFAVTAASYGLTVAPDTLKQHEGRGVTFTLTADGTEAPAGVSVTFSNNTIITGLPTGAQITKAGGLISVSTVTATASGEQKVEINVEGQKPTASFNVDAATYGLTVNTDTLKQHEGKEVTFTLTANDSPAPAGVPVSLSGSSDFTIALASGTTDASGQFKATLTTKSSANNQTVEINVDGQPKKTVAFTVSPASYGLTAAPAELPFNKATSVTFTLNRNDAAAPKDIVVALSGTSGLTISPTSATTNDKGQFTATLTGTSTGDKTVTATTVDGQTATATLNVPIVYTLALATSPSTPGESASSTLTATLLDNGVAVSGKTVTFTWAVKSTGAERGRTTVTTDASGKATYSLTSGGDRLTMTVKATAEGKSDSKDVQFGAALPSGFIVLAGGRKTWADAGAYCKAQGGKLPLINNVTSWKGRTPTTIDGFGTGGWPEGLPPNVSYWTGTVYSGDPRFAWSVTDGGYGGNVVETDTQDFSNRVACVPGP